MWWGEYRDCLLMVVLQLVLLALVFVLKSAAQIAEHLEENIEFHRYIVLGAGPGGIQQGHYLHSAGRDYVILERASAPSSFFEHFPRWRQLISINKRAVGRNDSLDFLYRHDWNSLLSEASHSSRSPVNTGTLHAETPCPPARRSSAAPCFASTFSSTDARITRNAVDARLLFGEYSSDYYPRADALLTYMRAWAAGTLVNASCSLHVAEPSETDAASGNTCNDDRPRDMPLKIRVNSTVTRVSRASEVVAAQFAGSRFELMTASGFRFACAVLIIATGLQSVPQPLGVNADEAIRRGWLQPYNNASVALHEYFDKRVLILGRGNAGFEFANALIGVASYVHVLGRAAGRMRLSLETHYPGDVRLVHAHLLETYMLKSLDGLAEVPFEHLLFEAGNSSDSAVAVSDVHARCEVDEYGRPDSRCFFRREYDVVISCPGWRFDGDIFDADVRPTLHANGKHPMVTPAYESVSVQGMYFVGAAAHALDARKSSGGFIHGFRYTNRALHRHLEELEQAKGDVAASGWPRRRYRGVSAIVNALLRRVNDAAGIYQMFGSLADVVVLAPTTLDTVQDFSDVGVLAAMHDVNVPTGLGADSWADGTGDVGNSVPRPLNKKRRSARSATNKRIAHQIASDSAIDAALTADYFEEVPVGLVASKVADSWAAQSAASGMQADAVPKAHEYITLTLEFGPTPPPPPPGTAPDVALRYNTDWKRDPFSRLRANIGLHNPHESAFLHPVLRYFLDGHLLATTHIIEDFHGIWTLHTPHVLPVARFFQEIGARRVAALIAYSRETLARAENISSYHSALALQWHAPANANGTVAASIISAFAAEPSSTHANVLDRLMSSTASRLMYRGAVVRGKEGWSLQLSVQAERTLLRDGPPFFVAHFYDAEPSMLSAAELRWTAAARERAALPLGFALLTSQSPHSIPVLPPPLSRDRAAMRDGLPPFLEMLYVNMTTTNPGLAVVLVRYRSGPSRLLAEEFGAVRPGEPSVAVIRVFDARQGGGITSIDGTNLSAAPARIEALWRRAATRA